VDSFKVRLVSVLVHMPVITVNMFVRDVFVLMAGMGMRMGGLRVSVLVIVGGGVVVFLTHSSISSSLGCKAATPRCELTPSFAT
jgi:hypothetical protein